MDFDSLDQGSNIYLLIEGGKRPELKIGTVKKKTARNNYQTQTPGILPTASIVKILDFTVDFDGTEESLPDIPASVEAASYKGKPWTVCSTPEAMLQAVDAMRGRAKTALAQQDYNNAVVEASEEFFERLNPRYAAEKERDRSIEELKRHREETDQQLQAIRQQNDRILAALGEISQTKKTTS